MAQELSSREVVVCSVEFGQRAARLMASHSSWNGGRCG